jgi:predicted transcriptional regulator
MMRTSMPGLGPLELEVMTILWQHIGPMSVRQVHTALGDRDRAYTTTMTTLVTLARKGLVHRQTVKDCLDVGRRGRAYRYTPTHSRGALLAARIEHMCAEMGADRGDRAEALAVILGAPR